MLKDIALNYLNEDQLRNVMSIVTADPNWDQSVLRWAAMEFNFGTLDSSVKDKIWNWYLKCNASLLKKPSQLKCLPASMYQNLDVENQGSWIIEPIELPLQENLMKYSKAEFKVQLTRKQACKIANAQNLCDGASSQVEKMPNVLLHFWCTASGEAILPPKLVVKIDGRVIPVKNRMAIVQFIKKAPHFYSTVTLYWVDDGKR